MVPDQEAICGEERARRLFLVLIYCAGARAGITVVCFCSGIERAHEKARLGRGRVVCPGRARAQVEAVPGVALRYEDVRQQTVAAPQVDETARGTGPAAPGLVGESRAVARVDWQRRDGLGAIRVFPEEHEERRYADILCAPR